MKKTTPKKTKADRAREEETVEVTFKMSRKDAHWAGALLDDYLFWFTGGGGEVLMTIREALEREGFDAEAQDFALAVNV